MLYRLAAPQIDNPQCEHALSILHVAWLQRCLVCLHCNSRVQLQCKMHSPTSPLIDFWQTGNVAVSPHEVQQPMWKLVHAA